MHLLAKIVLCIYKYTPSYVQPEDGFKTPKHVAKSCKFIRYLILKVVLYYTLMYYSINDISSHNKLT